MWNTRGRAALLGVVLGLVPGAMQGQVSVSADLRVGLYTQIGGTGTVGAAKGRLESVPDLALGVDLRPQTGLLGVRFSTVIGITEGTKFQPSNQCTNACTSRSIESGRFLATAVDLTAQRQTDYWTFRLGAGPGIARYEYGTEGFTQMLCPPGSMCTDSFRAGDTRVALHIGGAVARRFAGITVLATIENYVSKRVGGGISNDLSVALGLGVGSFWTPPPR